MHGELGRRDLFKAALAAAGAPLVARWPAPAHANNQAGGPAMKTAYDPAAKLDLKVTEVELRRAVSGRMLMARLAAIAQERGCSHMNLAVLHWNPAREFYRRIGFSHLEEWLPYDISGRALARLAAEDRGAHTRS